MPSMPWVKIWTEMLDDPKMADLNAEQKWMFVQLILVAGECDREGVITLTVKQLAWRLREQYDAKFMSNIGDLVDTGLIGYTEDDYLFVVSFSKRQDRPQSVKREQWRDAQNKKRGVIHDTSMTHAPVIPLEEEEEEEEEKEEEGEEEEEQKTSGDCFALYSSEKFGEMTQIISEKLGNYIDTYTASWVYDAMVICVNANKRNLAYLGGILKKWKANGKNSKKGTDTSDFWSNGNGKRDAYGLCATCHVSPCVCEVEEVAA